MDNHLKDLLISTLMESDEFTDALEASNPVLAATSARVAAFEAAELMVAAEVVEGYYKARFTDAVRNILTTE